MRESPEARQRPSESEELEQVEVAEGESETDARGETIDEVVAGRYRLLRELGVGGQGHTYLARDEQRGLEVALKKFDLRRAKEWKKVELFERECAVLRAIQHPAIPRYLAQFEFEGAFYLVMERVLGESLQELRLSGTRWTEAQVWRILEEVGAILDLLHGLQPPVIHRDLKPHNLIRRPDGTIALVDFGAVRDALRAGGGSTIAGTFGYMAPEQLQGQALPQTDIYGLGATVVALMTGREPEQLKHKGLRLDLKAEVSASPALLSVLDRMLEPDPDHRPRSVTEAMGSFAPPSHKAQQEAAQKAEPREQRKEQVWPERSGSTLTTQQGALELVGATLPFPVAILFASVLFVLSLPPWLLGSLLLPLLAVLLRAPEPGVLRTSAQWLQRAQVSLQQASRRVGRTALSSAHQRHERRLQRRLERSLAREQREQVRSQARKQRKRRG